MIHVIKKANGAENLGLKKSGDEVWSLRTSRCSYRKNHCSLGRKVSNLRFLVLPDFRSGAWLDRRVTETYVARKHVISWACSIQRLLQCVLPECVEWFVRRDYRKTIFCKSSIYQLIPSSNPTMPSNFLLKVCEGLAENRGDISGEVTPSSDARVCTAKISL